MNLQVAGFWFLSRVYSYILQAEQDLVGVHMSLPRVEIDGKFFFFFLMFGCFLFCHLVCKVLGVE